MTTGVLVPARRGVQPLFLTIPSFATAPALIIVGFYMMGSALKIEFDDPAEGIPAFLTILAMPTAYSISEGIAIGVISWTLLNVITGKAKEKKISPLMYCADRSVHPEIRPAVTGICSKQKAPAPAGAFVRLLVPARVGRAGFSRRTARKSWCASCPAPETEE